MLTHLDKGCRIVQPHLGLWWLFRGQSACGLRGVGVEGLGSLGRCLVSRYEVAMGGPGERGVAGGCSSIGVR